MVVVHTRNVQRLQRVLAVFGGTVVGAGAMVLVAATRAALWLWRREMRRARGGIDIFPDNTFGELFREYWRVPGWFVVVGILAGIGGYALLRSYLVPGERETRCRRCGYILRGISEARCPECGERI